MANHSTKQLGEIQISEDYLVRGDLKVNMQEVLVYYIDENHSLKETLAKFKLTVREWEKIRDTLGIKKSRLLSYEHNKKTLKELYGDEHYNNHEQQVQTCLEKYGCENVYQAEQIKQKCKEKKLEKYGDAHFSNKEKAKQTNLEKYGVEIPMKAKEVQEKARQTCLKHFGVEYPMQSEEVRIKYDFKAISEKAFETKKQHGTTNTSKIQTWFIAQLREIYGVDQVEEEYNADPRYPYHCDAYIKPTDQFIELNLYFTHGKHPFNSENLADVEFLATWEEKAKNCEFYANAIRVWTVSDPAKQACAKQNNLNYIVFYSEAEVLNFIEKLKKEIR